MSEEKKLVSLNEQALTDALVKRLQAFDYNEIIVENSNIYNYLVIAEAAEKVKRKYVKEKIHYNYVKRKLVKVIGK